MNKATQRPVQQKPYKWVRKDELKAQERAYWKDRESNGSSFF